MHCILQIYGLILASKRENIQNFRAMNKYNEKGNYLITLLICVQLIQIDFPLRAMARETVHWNMTIINGLKSGQLTLSCKSLEYYGEDLGKHVLNPGMKFSWGFDACDWNYHSFDIVCYNYYSCDFFWDDKTTNFQPWMYFDEGDRCESNTRAEWSVRENGFYFRCPETVFFDHWELRRDWNGVLK